MKTYLYLGIFLVLAACKGDQGDSQKQHLPWLINKTSQAETQVFGLSPGNITLREFAQHFERLADVRLFQKPDGTLFLEAYLGKTKVGRFDARLIAELDAPQALLSSILKASTERKPTPNNHWQYTLNDQQLLDALSLRVWRFMYLPIADYEAKQIGFFGEPESIEVLDSDAEYRFYPQKGLVVFWSKGGNDIFYYSSPRDFSRLVKAIENDKSPTPIPSQSIGTNHE